MPLEYLSGNCLAKYPFKDECTLLSGDGFSLPESYIADLQLSYGEQVPFRAYLYSFGIVSGVVTLVFKFADQDGSDIGTPVSVSFNTPLAEFSLVESFTSDGIIRLVVGTDFVTSPADLATTYWTIASAEIAQSATVQPVPKVTSIKLYNNGTLFKTIATSDVVFELETGNNFAFVNADNQAKLDVIPEAGAGLYDPCGSDSVIKSINGLTPNQIGNFLMFADDCYEVKRGTQGSPSWVYDYGLTFNNICAPKCTAAQMANFAHYLNRVQDGMNTIATHAADVANELKTQIADYVTFSITLKNRPYAKITYEKFQSSDPAYFYYSVVVGFYNPTPDPISVSITATSGAPVVAGSIRYKSSEVSKILSTLAYSGMVPCISASKFEYTIYGSPGGRTSASGSVGSARFSFSLVFD